jgi:hypothetical protein
MVLGIVVMDKQEGVCFEVLVYREAKVLGEVALYICVDCCAGECEEGHLPSFEELVLAVELVGD